METMETQVKNVIEKIRPYIQRDGGDVELSPSKCWAPVPNVFR